mmetsp:Transcript_41525/g.134150  ORF Transcript_41525/g.134150 Transcript_41525/m.134150 type:complete len:301 (-) Transcript_41525:350-1252(-)
MCFARLDGRVWRGRSPLARPPRPAAARLSCARRGLDSRRLSPPSGEAGDPSRHPRANRRGQGRRRLAAGGAAGGAAHGAASHAAGGAAGGAAAALPRPPRPRVDAGHAVEDVRLVRLAAWRRLLADGATLNERALEGCHGAGDRRLRLVDLVLRRGPRAERECDVEPMREDEVLQAGRRLGRQLHPLHGLVDEGERGLVVLHGEVGLEVGLQQPRRAAEGLGHRRGERVRVDVDAKGALLVPGGACGALPRRPSNLQPVHDGEWASLAGAVDQHRGEDRHYDAPFHLLPLAALALVVRVR